MLVLRDDADGIQPVRKVIDKYFAISAFVLLTYSAYDIMDGVFKISFDAFNKKLFPGRNRVNANWN